jgi:acyl carrier protein
MTEPASISDPLLTQLQLLIARKFRTGTSPGEFLTADEPLIGGRLGLDSLDPLELGLQIEEKFGIAIGSAADTSAAFASLAHLADFIRRHPPLHPVAA